MKHLDAISEMADRNSNYSNPVIDCQYTSPTILPTGMSVTEGTPNGFRYSHVLEVQIRGKDGSFTRSFFKATQQECVK